MVRLMKIMIIGGTGLLGYHIIDIALEKGYRVYATYHRTLPPKELESRWISLDVEDSNKVYDIISEVKPDIIIHTAAYTDVDGCEVNREQAYRVNYLSTAVLAKSSKNIEAKLVYISTDYVFNGEKGLYKEFDMPYPVNFYGLTKLLGEIAIENTYTIKYLIVRISGLYGYSPTGKKNFGIITLEKLLKGEEVNAFYDQYLSPTYVYFLAKKILEAIDKNIDGVIHIAGERLSRLEFAKLLSRSINSNELLIKPISINDAKLLAKRPRDSSLDTSYAKQLGLDMPPTSECINHFVRYYRKRIKLEVI